MKLNHKFKKMKKFSEIFVPKLEQLVQNVENTPFTVVKRDADYICCIGQYKLVTGRTYEELAENFDNNFWNIIWTISFITNSFIEKGQDIFVEENLEKGDNNE